MNVNTQKILEKFNSAITDLDIEYEEIVGISPTIKNGTYVLRV